MIVDDDDDDDADDADDAGGGVLLFEWKQRDLLG
jgi:hypothetical protein